jgi:hypothetical protein
LLLQAEASSVVDGAELDERDQNLLATDLRGFTRIEPKSFSPRETQNHGKTFSGFLCVSVPPLSIKH